MPKIDHHQSRTRTRQLRVRSKLFGTTERPRLSIYRSNRYTYLQAINDEKGITIASAHDRQATSGTKTERAQQLATEIAATLLKSGVKAVVLDRGAYRYHGRIRAVADAIRAAGVEV